MSYNFVSLYDYFKLGYGGISHFFTYNTLQEQILTTVCFCANQTETLLSLVAAKYQPVGCNVSQLDKMSKNLGLVSANRHI